MVTRPGRDRVSRAYVLLALGMLVALTGYYVVRWPSVGEFLTAVDPQPGVDRLFLDFFRFYYPTGAMLLQTGLPVAGFFYSPFAALLFALLAVFPPVTAACLWGMLQGIALLAALVVPARNGWLATPKFRLLYLFLLLTSLPLLHSFRWGQSSLLIFALVLGAYARHGQGKPRSGGLLLAAAVAVNYYAVIFLAGFILRRQFRFAGWCVAGLLVFLLVLPAIVLGWAGVADFYRAAQSGLSAASVNFVDNPNSQSVVNVVLRRFAPPAAWHAGLRFSLLAVAAGLAVLSGTLARRAAAGYPADLLLLYPLLPFLLPTCWPHYFVFLPLAAALVLQESGRRMGGRALIVFVAGVVVAALQSVFALLPGGPWSGYAGGGALLLTDLMLLAVAYGIFLVPVRGLRTTGPAAQ